MSGRRIAAVGALAFGIAASVFAIAMAIEDFPRGLAVLALVWFAVVAGFYGVLRRGSPRVVGLAAAAVAFVAAILLFLDDRLVEVLLVVGGFAVACALGRFAVRSAPT